VTDRKKNTANLVDGYARNWRNASTIQQRVWNSYL